MLFEGFHEGRYVIALVVAGRNIDSKCQKIFRAEPKIGLQHALESEKEKAGEDNQYE